MDNTQTIAAIKGQSVLIIGDVMLDRYISGETHRLSPEAPVPVLLETEEDCMPGGAANVAMNIVAMGGRAILTSVIGTGDVDLAALLQGIEVDFIVDHNRPLTTKTRMLIADQHVLRWDRESTQEISAADEQSLMAIIKAHLPNCTAVVLSDYSKGVLTDHVIAATIQLAQEHNVPVIVDPKGVDYNRYRGATMVKPNRSEVLAVYPDMEPHDAAARICRECGITAVMLTQSEDGLSLIQDGQDNIHLPAQAKQVVEVSGAGDSVVAAAALTLAAGGTLEQAAQIGNIAGSRSVEKQGTTTVQHDELEQAV